MGAGEGIRRGALSRHIRSRNKAHPYLLDLRRFLIACRVRQVPWEACRFSLGGTILTKLKILRLAKGIRQAKLARNVGISRTWLSSIECGWSRPSENVTDRIAQALGVEARWLFEKEENHGRD